MLVPRSWFLIRSPIKESTLFGEMANFKTWIGSIQDTLTASYTTIRKWSNPRNFTMIGTVYLCVESHSSQQKEFPVGKAWWHTSIISAMLDMEGERFRPKDSLPKSKLKQMGGRMARVVECLLSKCKALSSNPSTPPLSLSLSLTMC
jgi:hypothetical protein